MRKYSVPSLGVDQTGTLRRQRIELDLRAIQLGQRLQPPRPGEIVRLVIHHDSVVPRRPGTRGRSRPAPSFRQIEKERILTLDPRCRSHALDERIAEDVPEKTLDLPTLVRRHVVELTHEARGFRDRRGREVRALEQLVNARPLVRARVRRLLPRDSAIASTSRILVELQ